MPAHGLFEIRPSIEQAPEGPSTTGPPHAGTQQMMHVALPVIVALNN